MQRRAPDALRSPGLMLTRKAVNALPIELIVFALAAAVLLFLLYNVLGKKVGRQPEDVVQPAPTPVQQPTQQSPQAQFGPSLDPVAAEGAAQLKARDPGFEPSKFLEGARQAYETIVTAYAAGDRDTLKPLLAPRVAESFNAGIAAREQSGRTEQAELTHPPRADLDHVEVQGDLARARVRFLAEVRSRIEQDGVATQEERRTAELWTFERRIGANDPNWVLAKVEAASA